MNALVKSNIVQAVETLPQEAATDLGCLISKYVNAKSSYDRYSKMVDLLSSKLTNKQLRNVTWHKFESDDERQEELAWYRQMRNEYSDTERETRIALQAMGLLSL
jgi:hypothetical protein